MTIQFKTLMKKSLKRTVAAVKEEYKQKRFNYGSHNKVRLNKALGSVGKFELQDTTLLTPSVHEEHSKGWSEKLSVKMISGNKLSPCENRIDLFKKSLSF